MKRLMLSALVLALTMLAAPALAQNPASLTGTWIMQSATMFDQEHGYVQIDGPSGTWVVTEQRGHVFHGKKTWIENGVEQEEAIVGMIDNDGTLYISEGREGFTFGHLLSDGSLVLYYVESGGGGKAVQATFVRQ